MENPTLEALLGALAWSTDPPKEDGHYQVKYRVASTPAWYYSHDTFKEGGWVWRRQEMVEYAWRQIIEL